MSEKARRLALAVVDLDLPAGVLAELDEKVPGTADYLRGMRESLGQRIEPNEQGLLDLGHRGIHLSAFPLRLFSLLFEDNASLADRTDVLEAMFDEGVLCSSTGHPFAGFDFAEEIAGDVREVVTLIRLLGEVSSSLGKSSDEGAES